MRWHCCVSPSNDGLSTTCCEIIGWDAACRFTEAQALHTKEQLEQAEKARREVGTGRSALGAALLCRSVCLRFVLHHLPAGLFLPLFCTRSQVDDKIAELAAQVKAKEEAPAAGSSR